MKQTFNDSNSDDHIDIEIYKSKNRKYKDSEIYPYLEALSFFTSIKEITNNFVQKYKKNNRNPNLPLQFNSFKDFIDYFKEKNFYDVNNQRKEQKELLVKNPIKIYYYFLDELHKIFKDNYEENKIEGNNAAEYNIKGAKKIFKDFAQNDKSFISELFFGEKRISKKCQNCNLKTYIYKYLKAIPLNVEAIKGIYNLGDLINSIQRQHANRVFCSMCSNIQDSEVKIKITKKPQILIILILKLHKKIIINIPNFLYDKSYKLVCAEIYTDRGKLNNNIFCCLCSSCCKNNINKYKTVYDKNDKYNLYDDNILNKSLPYVLFYQRIKEIKEEEDENEEDSIDDINTTKKIISNDKSIIYDDNKLVNNNNIPNSKNNNINNNFINNNEIINFNSNMNLLNNNQFFMNNNFNFMNNNNMNFMNNNNNVNFMNNNNNMNFMNNNNNINFMNNNINNNINNNMINNMNNNINNNMNYNMNNNINDDLILNTENDQNKFILYFRFKKNGKEIFIDTNENDTFSNIVVQIKMKYNWAIEMIDDNNLYYNKKNINPKKTPKELKIPEEARIMIY